MHDSSPPRHPWICNWRWVAPVALLSWLVPQTYGQSSRTPRGGQRAAVNNEATDQESQVELQIYYDQSAPVTAPQEWLERLADLNLTDVKMNRATGAVKPESQPMRGGLRVTGVIDRSGDLKVPGGKFSVGQARQLKLHLATLGQPPETESSADSEPQPDWRERLAPAVEGSTRNVPLQDLLARWETAHSLEIDPFSPADRFDGQTLRQPVEVELEGLSIGTALAVVLSQLDREFRVAVPAHSGPSSDALRLQYGPRTKVPDPWPVGHRPNQPERQVAPQLLSFAPVAINQSPLDDVVVAITTRLKIPVYWDRLELEARQIDPHRITVSFPNKRAFYRQVLDQCLAKGKLRADLRVDEAGHPLLWIRPLTPRPTSTGRKAAP